MPDRRTKNRKKLESLLRDLFQFDHADLDFGIYRIMNLKRDEIERFIEHDLLDVVEEALTRFRDVDREELQTELAEKRDQLGPNAFDEDGNVRGEFRNLPIAREYTELHERLRQTAVAAETEARVFNDLWRFFSRYYDQGDFLTERRYSSRGAKYCVPYNGEEVMLHWANRNQYYVKTSERFTDYRFTVGHYTVRFSLQRADVPQDDVKGDTRYFVLHEELPVTYDDEARTLVIPFAYRPLTEDEEEHYLDIYNNQQSKSNRRKTVDRSVLCVALETEILEQLHEADLRAALTAVPEGKESSALGRHLSHYTARHTMDYFVHKDLGGFLRRELDGFLKTEVMNLGDVVSDEAAEVTQHVLTRMRVVRKIAHRIIEFLAQIEDFQKQLFEKRKFVVQTDYCITLDRVPQEFYAEILASEAQLEEWRQLYRMDQWPEDLFWQGTFDETFLAHHPSLMIDTAFFDRDFKARLLATFDDLDGVVGAVLIHGDNLQTLNLLQKKYSGQVKSTYIDPPYNTGEDDFIYKDQYRHSTWLAMMSERLRMGRTWLADDGGIFVSIDDNEQANLKQLMDRVFGESNAVASIVWQKRTSPDHRAAIGPAHDYILTYARSHRSFKEAVNRLPLSDERLSEYRNPDDDPRGPWASVDLTGQTGHATQNQFYEIVAPAGVAYRPPEGRCWALAESTFETLVEEGRIWFGQDGTARPRLKKYLSEAEGTAAWTWWPNDEVGHNQEATKELINLFHPGVEFETPKPVRLIKRMLKLTTSPNEGALCLDFFAGSGTTAHAVMGLNREDDGDRKCILLEMGKYFDTLLKPRILKVAFSNDWKDGVPQNRDGMSHMVKYHRIESYEDALNNIRVREPKGGQLELLRQFDDYMLHYMLDFETRDSPTLLAQEAFDKPFDYTLKIQRGHQKPEDTTVDLVETFHYLIGMHVRRLERYEHQGRTYVVSRGDVRTEHGIDSVVTIWRDTEGLDLEQEADWVNAEVLTDVVDRVYVNGYENFVRQAQPTEITFRKRMEAEIHGA